MEVTALDHVHVTVTDLGRSVAFYDPVMRLLGFRKGTMPIEGEPHAHYFNRVTQYSLRRARFATTAHDPYAPGLHHICSRSSRTVACAPSSATTGTSSRSSKTRYAGLL